MDRTGTQRWVADAGGHRTGAAQAPQRLGGAAVFPYGLGGGALMDMGQRMENLGRVIASRKTGAERFTAAGQPIGRTLADFWGWRLSDLLDNLERGALAEFIVATALGVPTDGVREGGAVWDLTTRDCGRIEVKSAAYLQAWAQKRLSRISFNTRKTLAWDPDTGEFAAVPQRHADIYVFALLDHTQKVTVDPLNLDQ